MKVVTLIHYLPVDDQNAFLDTDLPMLGAFVRPLTRY